MLAGCLLIISSPRRRGWPERRYSGREGKSDDGNSRLVAMLRRGKRAGEVERCMGVPGYANAGVRGVRESSIGSQVVTVLEFAARSLDAPVPVPASMSTDAHPL